MTKLIIKEKERLVIRGVGVQGTQGVQGDKGDTGDTGATGPAGSDGADGQGVPTGGTANQVLSKIDGTDYNTQWVNQSGGGGVSDIITANVTGTYNIDWSKIGATYVLTMTGNTTFSDINFTENETNAIDIFLNGNFVPTYSTDWEESPSSDSYSGTVTNHIIASVKNASSGTEAVLFSNENLST